MNLGLNTISVLSNVNKKKIRKQISQSVAKKAWVNKKKK